MPTAGMRKGYYVVWKYINRLPLRSKMVYKRARVYTSGIKLGWVGVNLSIKSGILLEYVYLTNASFVEHNNQNDSLDSQKINNE